MGRAIELAAVAIVVSLTASLSASADYSSSVGAACNEANGASSNVWSAGDMRNTDTSQYLELSCPVSTFNLGVSSVSGQVTYADNNGSTTYTTRREVDVGCQLFTTDGDRSSFTWGSTQWSLYSPGTDTMSLPSQTFYDSGVTAIYCSVPEHTGSGTASAIRNYYVE